MEAVLLWLTRPPWMARAKCRGVNPELFYPNRGGESVAVADRAKQCCNGQDGGPPCVVRMACLEYALANRERFGVWGGKSERERKRLSANYLGYWDEKDNRAEADRLAKEIRRGSQVRQRATR